MAAEQTLPRWGGVEVLVSRVALMSGECLVTEGECLHVDLKAPVAELK